MREKKRKRERKREKKREGSSSTNRHSKALWRAVLSGVSVDWMDQVSFTMLHFAP